MVDPSPDGPSGLPAGRFDHRRRLRTQRFIVGKHSGNTRVLRSPPHGGEPVDVTLLRWPDEDARRARLSVAGDPRLLLVEDGTGPPTDLRLPRGLDPRAGGRGRRAGPGRRPHPPQPGPPPRRTRPRPARRPPLRRPVGGPAAAGGPSHRRPRRPLRRRRQPGGPGARRMARRRSRPQCPRRPRPAAAAAAVAPRPRHPHRAVPRLPPGDGAARSGRADATVDGGRCVWIRRRAGSPAGREYGGRPIWVIGCTPYSDRPPAGRRLSPGSRFRLWHRPAFARSENAGGASPADGASSARFRRLASGRCGVDALLEGPNPARRPSPPRCRNGQARERVMSYAAYFGARPIDDAIPSSFGRRPGSGITRARSQAGAGGPQPHRLLLRRIGPFSSALRPALL